MIPFVDLRAHHARFARDFRRKMDALLRNSQFILGEEVAEFEKEFARYIGVKQAVGVANGTDALVLALKASGIGPGDEVIVPSLTFGATGLAVSLAGATPRFADVEDETGCLDPGGLRATTRTKAVIPVHLFGHPANLGLILEFARAHGLKVIEDTAQAHGATWNGRRVGGIGDAGCFSFYPSKNLGALGDGGMVVTNDGELADRLRMWRHVGQRAKYEHAVVGHNSRLDSLQAAFLRVKLRKLDVHNRMRQKNAEIYAKALGGCVGTPVVRSGCTHVYHLYQIRSSRRESIRARLSEAGIACGVYYPIPLHRQPCFAGNGDACPVSEKLAGELLALPMYPELTAAQIRTVARCVRSSATPSPSSSSRSEERSPRLPVRGAR